MAAVASSPGLTAAALTALLSSDGERPVVAWVNVLERRVRDHEIDRDRAVDRLLAPFVAVGLVRLGADGYLPTAEGREVGHSLGAERRRQ